MSLFRKISGLAGENIATEAITYLLSSSKGHLPFQKLFYNRIFGTPWTAVDLGADVATQPSFEFGRPDFLILTNDSLIVVETKLGSYLSGDDQLLRYCEVFNRSTELRGWFPFIEPNRIERKILALLAPQSTIDLSIKATSDRCSNETGKDFESWCQDNEITFVQISWEDVLSDLDVTDSLQNELFLFVRDFINQELSEDEMAILKDTNVPNALTKLYSIIQDMRNHLVANGVEAGRMSQSYNYFGFTIDARAFSCWFGYFLPIWGQFETPVFLQIREDWIQEEKTEILSKLSKSGFKNEETHEFVRPFQVDSIASWKEDLLELLSRLSK